MPPPDPRPVLFLLHGIGKHSPEWAQAEDGPVQALTAAAQQYGCFGGEGLDKWVEFIPIRYDDIFDRLMAKWAEQAKELRPWSAALGSGLLDSGVDLLAKGDSGGLVPAVGCDVLLYRGFKLFAQRIQLHVAYEMAKAISERTVGVHGAPPRFYVMAHSLGTAVVHDAMQRLATESWRDAEEVEPGDPQGIRRQLDGLDQIRSSGFKPGQFRFEALFQVANTSRLMQMTDVGPVDSVVRPGAGIQLYFNVDHNFDPVSKVLPFTMPQGWTDSRGGAEIEVSHFYQDNIHGFSHYLRHPKVHAALFRQLFRADFRISPQEIDGIRAFPDIGKAFSQMQADRLQGVLRPWLEKAARAAAPTLQTIRLWLDLFRDVKGVLGIP